MIPIFVQILASGFLLGAIYALISIGLTLIFGVSRIANFAQGEFVMLGMYATYWLTTSAGLDPYVAMLFVIPIMFIFGILVGILVIRPILFAPPVAQIFATVGLSLLMQNIALFLWGADFRSIRPAFSGVVLRWGWLSFSLAQVIAFGVAMFVILLLHFFLKYSHMGKAMRAVAQDRPASSLMSINVESVDLLTFGLGTALAGIAGALLMPLMPVYPTIGINFVLIAFVVVVLGGLGSVMGALLGGLAIGMIETMTGFFAGSALRQFAYFVVFIIVLLVRPSGIFGQRGAEVSGIK